MHFLQAINSDLSVLIVCNKTGGTIKGDIKKIITIVRKRIRVASLKDSVMCNISLTDVSTVHVGKNKEWHFIQSGVGVIKQEIMSL